MIKRKKIWITAVTFLTAMFLLSGCAQGAKHFTAILTNQPEQDAAVEVEPETMINDMNRSGIYDSEDAAVSCEKIWKRGPYNFKILRPHADIRCPTTARQRYMTRMTRRFP